MSGSLPMMVISRALNVRGLLERNYCRRALYGESEDNAMYNKNDRTMEVYVEAGAYARLLSDVGTKAAVAMSRILPAKEADKLVYLLNKIDEVSSDLLIRRLSYAAEHFDFAEIIPISALKKDNLSELLQTIKNYLQDSVQYYPEDMKTNMNREFRIAEIIREKIILNMHEEVPHLVACRVEEIREKTSKVQIEATIICNKSSHKGIIIGHNGAMLKKINDAASTDISRLFDGKKIILSLYVKVEEDWLNSEKQLFDLGYFSGDRDE